jgi:hypothetical protein
MTSPAESGWFGPKLVAKLGGGSGTTGSGSAGGREWVKRPKAASSSATVSSELVETGE